MQSKTLASVIVFVLIVSGCKKERIAKDREPVFSSEYISDQASLAGKKDPGCLINVGAVALPYATQWDVTINYENAESNPKSALIQVVDSSTNWIVFEQEIERIAAGVGTVTFTFSISGNGPWFISIRSYSKPHIPKDENDYCGIVTGRLLSPVSCIDPSQVCNTCVCLDAYEPVCGCNGVTYGNSCLASHAGVMTWTQGAWGL